MLFWFLQTLPKVKGHAYGMQTWRINRLKSKRQWKLRLRKHTALGNLKCKAGDAVSWEGIQCP